MSTEYQFHEAANIFPLLDGEDLQGLAEDIRQHGLRCPIELLDGKILDGRNRKTACTLARVQPQFITVTTDDPVAYVMSKNLHRRQLTASQRAMVAARAREFYDKQAKERQVRKPAGSVPENLPEQKGDARDAAGKAVGVSGKLVDNASKVLRDGIPELARAVDEGRLSVSAAADFADSFDSVQREVAEKARFSGGRFRRPEMKLATDEVEKVKSPDSKAIFLANEAVDALKRIPKNDPLRKRGFQIVTDWIRANSK